MAAVDSETIELSIGDHEGSLCYDSDSPDAVEVDKVAREMINTSNKTYFS